jgi:hypothetical protein
VDWDSALRENAGRTNPLGLFDLNRNIRAVGRAYKQLIADWRNVLPTQSVCLRVPVVLPNGAEVEQQEKIQQQMIERNSYPRTEPSSPNRHS